MSRTDDLNRFYSLLEQIRKQEGGFRYLRDSTGKTGWPKRGIYFFFEGGESRDGLDASRVVRVGTHALTDTSKTTLWNRLSTHKGQTNGRGNHRGSIFRKRIGQALLNRAAELGDTLSCATWGEGSSAPASIVEAEAFLEMEVSQRIGSMPFLWLSVDDAPGKASSRGFLEKNCIGLLSNFDRPGIDVPSPSWLGRFSEKDTIRESGLWNTDCVKESYAPMFLDLLDTFVSAGRKSLAI
jgi:hypothetical protein